MPDNGKDRRSWLRLYANEAAVAVVCLLYLAAAVLHPIDSGKTLIEILTGTAMSFLVATAVNNLFRNQGIILGDRDPCVSEAVARHEALASETAPYIEELTEFCMRETERALRRERVRILAEESLTLADAFDGDGRPKPYEFHPVAWKPFRRGWIRAVRFNRTEARRAAVCIKATRLRITPLSAGELISEGNRRGDPFYMGRSKRTFYGQEMRNGMLSRLGVAVIFGYWSVELISSFTPALLLWRLLQIGLLLAGGVMTLHGATDYMKGEYRSRMLSKAAYLVQFQEGRKKAHECKEESVADGEIPAGAGECGTDGQRVGTEPERCPEPVG